MKLHPVHTLYLVNDLHTMIAIMEEKLNQYKAKNPFIDSSYQEAVIQSLKNIAEAMVQVHANTEYLYEQYQNLIAFTNQIVDKYIEPIKQERLKVIYADPLIFK